jgi:hypothetical protein
VVVAVVSGTAVVTVTVVCGTTVVEFDEAGADAVEAPSSPHDAAMARNATTTRTDLANLTTRLNDD